MKRILIVDDEVHFCTALKRNLEASGAYEVTACSDSSQAQALTQQIRPDLILMDILMPGENGCEIACCLKEDPKTERIPVIFLTAVMTQEELKKAKNQGNPTVLAKPIRVAELLRVIDSRLAAA